MKSIIKSEKFSDILFDVRGAILEVASAMEIAGKNVRRLNMGNFADFDFDVPEEITTSISRNLRKSAGYSDGKGIAESRLALVEEARSQGISGVKFEDVHLGNGASDLIATALNAFLDDGDELLIPSPDFPLWTAATVLSGGRPAHYTCDEQNAWMPDLDDLRSRIGPRTKGLVVVNPNNPTGALYPRKLLLELIEIARTHDLVLFADEVCSKIVYDNAEHVSIASLATDVVILTFNSLSKNYLSGGYRAGWMIVSGPRDTAKDYVAGLNLLANMKLCANVPGQWAIAAALRGSQGMRTLVGPGGRLRRQRDLAFDLLSEIPGVSCVRPAASVYMFARLDPTVYPVADDKRFFLDLLLETQVMVTPGTGFNCKTSNHFRIVFLPHEEELRSALQSISGFLARRRAEFGTA